MKYGVLVVLCAGILLTAAAPTQDAASQDAVLQRALDDAAKHTAVSAKADDSSAAVESEKGEEFALNVLDKLLDFASAKYGKGTTSNPSSTKESSVAVESQPAGLLGTPDDDDSPKALPSIPYSKLSTTEDPNKGNGRIYLPRIIYPNSYRHIKSSTSLETDDDSNEAQIQAFAALLGTALKAFKVFKALKGLKSLIPSSGSNSGSNTRSYTGDRGTSTTPSGYGNLARRFLGFPGDNENYGSNGPSSFGPQRLDTDIEDEQTAEEQVTEEAEIERLKWLKSFVGKALNVLSHKLRPRSRSPDEDRQAVSRPTKWRDLGRNILETIGDRLNSPDEGQEEEAEAAHSREDVWDGNSPAEIEGLRSLLSKSLGRIDRRLKPSTRSPEEDDEAVMNPKKWKDLGRNFIRVLRDKLESGQDGPNEVQIEGKYQDQDIEGETEEKMAEIEFWKKVIPIAIKGYKLYRSIKDRG